MTEVIAAMLFGFALIGLEAIVPGAFLGSLVLSALFSQRIWPTRHSAAGLLPGHLTLGSLGAI